MWGGGGREGDFVYMYSLENFSSAFKHETSLVKIVT